MAEEELHQRKGQRIGKPKEGKKNDHEVTPAPTKATPEGPVMMTNNDAEFQRKDAAASSVGTGSITINTNEGIDVPQCDSPWNQHR